MTELEELRREVAGLAAQVKSLAQNDIEMTGTFDVRESQNAHDVNTSWIVRHPLSNAIYSPAQTKALGDTCCEIDSHGAAFRS